MPLKAKYCSQCGAAIASKIVEDRTRSVCPACDTIFYENPLPVAAAIVLNEKREVLLVKRKREPHKGMWCLPMGFAEMGETIAAAAARELREEACIRSHPLRLVDADSFHSDFYGDLLIVTFEMEKASGTEQAGDDAEAFSYFPLAQLPTLAFRSNTKALSAFADIHRDEWAIQDSFESLQANEGDEMLSDALVSFVQDNADEITHMWFEEVRSKPSTLSYQRVDADQLRERGRFAVSQFGRWLKGNEADQEVRDFYNVLGRDRKAQGFALYEVLSSLMLLRKHLWVYSRSRGVWDRPIDVYKVLELNRRIAVFFDKALYNTALGFAE